MPSFYPPETSRCAAIRTSDETALPYPDTEGCAIERNSPNEPSPPLFSTLQDLPAQARKAAFDLLARREHSRSELQQKLLIRFTKRYPDASRHLLAEVLASVLGDIQQEGLQCDQRYLEMMVRGRINQGYGPLRISQELKQKKVAIDGDFEDLLESLLDHNGEEWLARARQVRIKRFGEKAVEGQKERARQMRFLQYRGFSGDQIRYALSVTP